MFARRRSVSAGPAAQIYNRPITAPSNVWKVQLQPDEEWGPGVRGERLLDRSPGTRLVSAVWELDPGAASPKYHAHHATEELLLLLNGEATLRTPTGERQIEAGEVVHFPTGAAGAHQVINSSEAIVRYLMVAAHSGFDAIEYIDDQEVIVYSNTDSLIQGEPLFFSYELSQGDPRN